MEDKRLNEPPCYKNEVMREARNCHGENKEPDLTGGELFDKCPIHSTNENPECVSIYQLYEECCGFQVKKPVTIYETKSGGKILETINPIKFLPTPGTIANQPANIMSAFRIIAAKLQEIISE